TELYYRTVTGDSTTPASAVEENLTEAQSLIQEFLCRTLPFGVYTETLRLWPNRIVYPSAVPVASVPASANGERYDECIIMNVTPDDTPFLEFPNDWGESNEPFGGRRGTGYETRYWYATVTYEGGFTADTLPVS